jgi:DNA polymerase type B, organellar and viral
MTIHLFLRRVASEAIAAKEALKLNYKFTFLKAYEYSKYDLFNDYVKHFYEIKKNASIDSPERFIAIASLAFKSTIRLFRKKIRFNRNC